MVCRLGLRGSGAEHTATSSTAVIDFSHSFVSNNCKFMNSAFVWRSGDFFRLNLVKYFYESGFY